MTSQEKMYVQEAQYGIIAALEALEVSGKPNIFISGALKIALGDLERALGKAA